MAARLETTPLTGVVTRSSLHRGSSLSSAVSLTSIVEGVEGNVVRVEACHVRV